MASGWLKLSLSEGIEPLVGLVSTVLGGRNLEESFSRRVEFFKLVVEGRPGLNRGARQN